MHRKAIRLIKKQNINYLLKSNSFNKFYDNVSIKNHQNEFLVFLDDNQLISPENNLVSYPSFSLIKSIADEWIVQKDSINLESMLMNKLFFTALDKVNPNLSIHIDELLNFIDFDLLCYHVKAPHDLKKIQEKKFHPIILWLSTEYRISPTINHEIISIPNKEDVKLNLRELLYSFDFIELTLLQFLINILGSIILGIAFLKGRLSENEIIKLIYLEEDWRANLSGDKENSYDEKKNILADMKLVKKIINIK